MSAAALPGALVDHPRLSQWVAFPAPGRVAVATGKVEIGQGVLTALVQIAAEQLDVAVDRVAIASGDTDRTPNEGYTAGSQSIQFGGVALRRACADVRELYIRSAAEALGCPAADLSIADGRILCQGAPTGLDYWSLASAVNLDTPATGNSPLKPPAEHRVIGRNAGRLDLPAKVFGEPVFIHDMVLDGMLHARVVRQPCPSASLTSVDEAAIRRAAEGQFDIIRYGNFLAILGEDETVVEASAAVAAGHVKWDGVEAVNPLQQEARWLLQQPTIDRVIGPPEPDDPVRGANRHEAAYSRPHLAHASVAPSCGLALMQDSHLKVWTHSQGVFPFRVALARALEMRPADISVTHVQGPGCYGHNGADDAAADAAVIAFLRPGRPIRVRWRREDEFGFEPVAPTMMVQVRAALDEAGRPVDWTAEIWSGTHSTRPGSAGNLLAAEALPKPSPPPKPGDVPEAGGGGATRNGEPLYDIPARRIIHHLVPATPVRTSALRGLGAMPNVFAIESFIDELAERIGADPVSYRLSLLTDPRATRVVEQVARMADWKAGVAAGSGHGRGIGFSRYKNRAAYAAVIAEVDVDEDIRLRRVWCAADAGLVINPDGAINQLEGGILQSASWVLKEQVQLAGTGISSLDWDSYPVLRFTEVPELFVELVASDSNDPLGVGEATAGPAAAAIGNAVAHALGARLRDLPLTRERMMAALLAE